MSSIARVVGSECTKPGHHRRLLKYQEGEDWPKMRRQRWGIRSNKLANTSVNKLVDQHKENNGSGFFGCPGPTILLSSTAKKKKRLLIMFKAVGIREEVEVEIKSPARGSMSESTERLVHRLKGRRV
jgi:hypothetical protein